MRRLFTESRLVIASHNLGKVREFEEFLTPFVPHLYNAHDLTLPSIEESGQTFLENAVLKAQNTATIIHIPCLSDDSGLVVNGLNGAPGIYSARWGGEERNFYHAMQKVHAQLGNNPDRSARFVCVLCLAWPDGHTETVEGTVEGTLVWPPRGTTGFGYDPMFQPIGYTLTFGEIPPSEKQVISHRAQAIHKLLRACFNTSL